MSTFFASTELTSSLWFKKCPASLVFLNFLLFHFIKQSNSQQFPPPHSKRLNSLFYGPAVIQLFPSIYRALLPTYDFNSPFIIHMFTFSINIFSSGRKIFTQSYFCLSILLTPPKRQQSHFLNSVSFCTHERSTEYRVVQ